MRESRLGRTENGLEARRRVPFDKRLDQPLAEFLEVWPQQLSAENLHATRELCESLYPTTAADHAAGRPVTSEDHLVPGIRQNPAVPVSLYRPESAVAPKPLIFFLHFGGLVLGNRFMEDIKLFDLAEATGASILSVEYRLAPEYPFPAAIDDCETAWAWVVEQAPVLGVDPARIVLVGESAGGGLAAALAVRIRDAGGVQPAGQMLVTPMLDDRNDSKSVVQMDGVGIWDRDSNAFGWSCYLGVAAGSAGVTADAAAARVADASGLPMAFIEAADAEIFRDEVVSFARRLWADGVSAELHIWPGGCHTFYALVPDSSLAASAHGARVAWLRRILE